MSNFEPFLATIPRLPVVAALAVFLSTQVVFVRGFVVPVVHHGVLFESSCPVHQVSPRSTYCKRLTTGFQQNHPFHQEQYYARRATKNPRHHHRQAPLTLMSSLSALPPLLSSLPALPPASVMTNGASIVGGMACLILYHVGLYRTEKAGNRTWRSAQADTREKWAKFVRESEGWLYAIQTLRNAITAQTFLATTVLSLLTVISGRLWEMLKSLPTTAAGGAGAGVGLPGGRKTFVAQFTLIAASMLASAYQFLQSARLMTHAGFMFPVSASTTKVDRIMRKSQNSQWAGLRFLYLSAGLLSWIIGGPIVFFVASILLTLFFRKIDQVPEGIDDDHSYDI